MAHRQQRRAIVAVHGRDRRGDRRVTPGRGGVYRHFTNARATIVISHTQADYRHFRFTAALSRSEEHTSELQSLMRLSYAVFCLKKNNKTDHKTQITEPIDRDHNHLYITTT